MACNYKHLIQTEPATDSRSPGYKSKDFNNVILPSDEDLTLYKTFTTAVEKFGPANCLGQRVIDSNGVAGIYTYWTYKDTAERVERLATAMAAAGIKRGQKVGVFSVNCREWMLTMQACNRMSYTCVPLYDTLGEDAIEYVVNHSESVIVFCSTANLPKIEKTMPKVKDQVKRVIYWGSADDAVVQRIAGMHVTIDHFDAFVAKEEGSSVPPDPPTASDLCTIMYTSGTTGVPKGVMMTHRAVASAVYSLKAYTDALADIGPGDGYLSFLPLAHVFDRMGEEHTLICGSCIGYYQGDVTKLVDDIVEFKPTIFAAVPRVFDRMYTRIKEKINGSNWLKRVLFNWGFGRKAQALRDGIPHAQASPLFDALVFRQIKARLGGRVKLIISGGAPIAPHTEEFMKVCFCAPVVQGYGLTETAAGTCITLPDDSQMAGTVGLPTPFVTMALESVPEMNYDANADVQKGEVLFKGPVLFEGYYKSPSQTAEVVEKDGWFHTGDIGMIAPDGCLKLIDRKKNILKLSQGEYVALEMVEGAYKESMAIEQIWVYGNSFKNFLVAVVIPTATFVKKWAADHQKAYDYAALCKDDLLVAALKEVLDIKAKEKRLKGFEVVKRLELDSEQFSVENDLLTPTFKLKRPQLQKKYQQTIDALYDS